MTRHWRQRGRRDCRSWSRDTFILYLLISPSLVSSCQKSTECCPAPVGQLKGGSGYLTDVKLKTFHKRMLPGCSGCYEVAAQLKISNSLQFVEFRSFLSSQGCSILVLQIFVTPTHSCKVFPNSEIQLSDIHKISFPIVYSVKISQST